MAAETQPFQLSTLLSAEALKALAAVPAQIVLLQDFWPLAVNLAIDNQSSIYDAYPFLFLPAFPGLSPREIVPFAVASRLFASSIFVADDIMDEPRSRNGPIVDVLRVQAMQAEGYRLLYQLFPSGSKFWDRFRDYHSAYALACLLEMRALRQNAGQLGNQPVSEAELLRIGRGKSGLSRFVVAGLAELSGDESNLPGLLESISHYYMARQILDDLADWRQDLKRGFPSLPLQRALGSRLERLPQAGVDEEKLAMVKLYLQGQAEYVLRIAQREADAAQEQIRDLPPTPWAHLLTRLSRQIDELRERTRLIANADGIPSLETVCTT